MDIRTLIVLITVSLAAHHFRTAEAAAGVLDTRPSEVATTSVPVLDFGRFLTGDEYERYDFSRQLLSALVGPGFFYLKNHGVPSDLVWQVFNSTENFFSQDIDEKRKFTTEGVPQGYKGNGEEVLYGRLPDHKESVSVNLNNIDALEGAGHVDSSFRKIWHSLVDVEYELMKAYSLALNQDESFFADLVKPAPVEQTVSVLRVNRYPPLPEESEQYMCAPHTDFGFASLLFQNGVSGLELWNQITHRWERVDPIEGTMVVNTGNLLQRFSNDLFYSSLHRVMPNTNAGDEVRRSIVFFGVPNYGSVCDYSLLKSKYAAVDTTQFIADRVAEIYAKAEEDGIKQYYGWARDAMELAKRELEAEESATATCTSPDGSCSVEID